MENQSSIEELTSLQKELGYKQGNVSIIALLGLVGEAGEVLAETAIINQTVSGDFSNDIQNTIAWCKSLDAHKKTIRKSNPTNTKNLVFIHEKDFDAELADCFYYLNIIATNRGLTLNDLAKMAHDKVRAKQASGGSSEDTNFNK